MPGDSWKNSAPAYANVLSSTKAAIRRAHELGILYADDTWSPLSDLTLRILLERASIRTEYVPLQGLVEIVWPPICGIHVLYVERAQTDAEKRFAVRHGLGHVLAGHVDDVSFAHDRHDPLCHEERVADMFAFADLIPDRKVQELREARYRPWDISCWIIEEMRRHCPNWHYARQLDRLKMLDPLPGRPA